MKYHSRKIALADFLLQSTWQVSMKKHKKTNVFIFSGNDNERSDKTR